MNNEGRCIIEEERGELLGNLRWAPMLPKLHFLFLQTFITSFTWRNMKK